MKKLGLIILMALVLTVGGVYATFNYARKEVESASETLNSKVLAGVDTETPKGTISIDVSKVVLRIDDFTSSHKTGLQIQNSEIKVTFTPAKDAEPLVAEEGIDLKLEISFTRNTLKLNGVDHAIFKTTTAYDTGVTLVAKDATKVATQNGNKFEFTVDLSQYLTVSEIPLPTLADYNTFAGFFNNDTPENAVVTITVSEVK